MIIYVASSHEDGNVDSARDKDDDEVTVLNPKWTEFEFNFGKGRVREEQGKSKGRAEKGPPRYLILGAPFGPPSRARIPFETVTSVGQRTHPGGGVNPYPSIQPAPPVSGDP